jgi:hypothetical protein
MLLVELVEELVEDAGDGGELGGDGHGGFLVRGCTHSFFTCTVMASLGYMAAA